MKKLLRYLRLAQLLVTASYKRQIAYRASFFIAAIAKFTRVGLYLLLFESLLSFTSVIGGFGREAVLAHYATAYVLVLLAQTSFQRNLTFGIVRLIQRGRLDGMLVRPIHPLFQVAFNDGDLYDTITVIPLMFFLAATVARVPGLTVGRIVAYLAFFPVTLLFLFGISALLSTLSFKIVRSNGAGRVLISVFRSAQYPVTAFGGGWQTLFLYILPIGLIATVPMLALTGSLHAGLAITSVMMGVGCFFIGCVTWMRGLKSYTSASS